MPNVEPKVNDGMLAKDQEKDESTEKRQKELISESPFYDGAEFPKEKEEVKEEPEKEVEEEVKEEVVEETETDETSEVNQEKKTEQASDEKKESSEDDTQEVIALREEVERLKEENSSLRSTVQASNQVANLIKDIGIDEIDQNKQAVVLKQMKQVADDIQNVPSLGEALKKYYSGELVEVEEKSPQDFMPEGEFFDTTEQYEKGTESFKAFRSWQRYLNESEAKKQDFFQRLEQDRQTNETLGNGFVEQVKKVVNGFAKVKAEISNRFTIDDDTWDKFKKFYSSGDDEIIKAAFSVFASKNGMKDRITQKIEGNKTKSNSILDSKTKKSVDSGRRDNNGVPLDFDEKQKELAGELFGEEF